MFGMFNATKKDGDENRDTIEVEITDDEIIEEDLGQVALDILELEDSIIIIAPLAGVDINEVDISVARNILTISGERKTPEIYNDAGKILVQECFFGPYSRSIILPENLALNKIRATMENNLLIVEIPKLQFPSKSIKIDKLEG
ncbi:MAG: Hsp20/alpha crystallin family protein [Candidatus Gracilibacteria bacterium]|nr:Hsp20/alpha crystallin family protein [Candidatus Gracilibacteria bacterium]MDD2908487.1 Hsp20/alpha crystallin family protein [Candidatus Gracilibacteria bacterium]